MYKLKSLKIANSHSNKTWYRLLNDGRLDPFLMFFICFYSSLSLDDGRIRLGIKRNWNETENWLEKRSTPFFLPAPVTSPPKRKCPDIPALPSHSFPPDLSFWEKVHAYDCKSSTLEAVVTSVSLLTRQIASGEIILLTDNELLAFTGDREKSKLRDLINSDHRYSRHFLLP